MIAYMPSSIPFNPAGSIPTPPLRLATVECPQVRGLAIAPQRVLDIQRPVRCMRRPEGIARATDPDLIVAIMTWPEHHARAFARAAAGHIRAFVRRGFRTQTALRIVPPELAVGTVATPVVDFRAIRRAAILQIQAAAMVIAQLAPHWLRRRLRRLYHRVIYRQPLTFVGQIAVIKPHHRGTRRVACFFQL